MAREYDHLFKLLIIGDSGKEAVAGAFAAQERVVSRRGQRSIGPELRACVPWE